MKDGTKKVIGIVISCIITFVLYNYFFIYKANTNDIVVAKTGTLIFKSPDYTDMAGSLLPEGSRGVVTEKTMKNFGQFISGQDADYYIKIRVIKGPNKGEDYWLWGNSDSIEIIKQ